MIGHYPASTYVCELNSEMKTIDVFCGQMPYSVYAHLAEQDFLATLTVTLSMSSLLHYSVMACQWHRGH